MDAYEALLAIAYTPASACKTANFLDHIANALLNNSPEAWLHFSTAGFDDDVRPLMEALQRIGSSDPHERLRVIITAQVVAAQLRANSTDEAN